MYICMYVYIYIYMYVYVYISLSLYTYIYIYIYTCVCVCVYMYIYIYIYIHIFRNALVQQLLAAAPDVAGLQEAGGAPKHNFQKTDIYIYIYICISLSLSLYIYIYIYIYVCRSCRRLRFVNAHLYTDIRDISCTVLTTIAYYTRLY